MVVRKAVMTAPGGLVEKSHSVSQMAHSPLPALQQEARIAPIGSDAEFRERTAKTEYV